ncbi:MULTISPECIES: bifunctional diguanylate cyclase/phosphodiesterase [unclassified Oceanobacillus]|uniref:putative bifunctional diguanylate cyclase/phosphodiesterase n=1 Tax=unclassified Oceanobacillus TaxID=2630292 RepID=UPI0012EB1979|nr:GGDEF domain-containing phosphodiesterase [Oceanobacillus sp. AG]
MNETSKKLDQIKFKFQHEIEKAINDLAMIIIFNHQGIIQYVNKRFTEVTQYTQEELLGNALTNIFPEDFSTLVNEAANNQRKWSGDIRQQKKDGTYYWVEANLSPTSDAATGEAHYVLIQREMTERKEYEQMMENLAYVDPLTNLPNRNYMKKWVTEKQHPADTKITILFIDIDRFKTINDNFGQDIGDQVFITLAKRLETCVGKESLIFRYDGEEFIILLENHSREDTNRLVNQILHTIREPVRIDYHELLLTASIGISSGHPFLAERDATTALEDLVKKADTAMYHAKKQGRNNFQFHSDNQIRELDRDYQIELEVTDALERNEFSLVYQPLFNLKTNKIVGVESLLRWDNRLLGKVSPMEFIPVLEETGLIVPVGKWILHSVCHQMMSWQQQGLFLQRVSVNVSPLQFRDPYFIADLKEILHEAQLDASYLELEITEGTLLDIEDSTKKLHDLQELGVKLSIDDFGTGYSSLSYLKQLPIDTLKIDKSFIDDLDRDGKIIVNTIISMGKNLQFRIIAEGIENSDQFKYLQEQQCHEGQGYFFSRPVNSERIEELYHSLQ